MERVFSKKNMSQSTIHIYCTSIGVQMTLEMLEKRFWSIATQCSGVEGLCPLSCTDNPDVNCYVIDSNGFIIISKDRTDVGRFLGKIDGSVMSQLLKMGMFKRVLLYDYQAMCKVNPHYASGARPLLSPFFNLLAALRWFLSNFLLFLLDFNIYSLWHSDPFAEAKTLFHASNKKSKGDILQPCDTEMFVINQIPDSNLLLVVIQADCDCSRQYVPITMEPKEVKYILKTPAKSGSTDHTLRR
ncbi:hypothetical protein cypCar_00025508 [Cyprinus carpio]|nr:hypothetical protein cypCar_00025508 [Cyprinus carpio]